MRTTRTTTRNIALLAGWAVLVLSIAWTAQTVQDTADEIDYRVCSLSDTVTSQAMADVSTYGLSKADEQAALDDLLNDFKVACPDYSDPVAGKRTSPQAGQ